MSNAIVPQSPSKPVTGRTITLAAVGGALGLVLFGPVGLALGAAAGAAASKLGKPADHGVLTPARADVFGVAMESLRDPREFRMLADAFDRKGLGDQAEMLRRRAQLREEPAEVKERRREAFKAAMASDDPDKVEQVAAAFERRAATHAARRLRFHVRALRALHTSGQRFLPAAPVPEATVASTVASVDAPAASSDEDQEHFADALGKAVIAFGANSEQAFTAAKNLVMARGGQPTGEAITAAIGAAIEAVRERAARGSDPHLRIELPDDAAHVVTAPEHDAAAQAATEARA